MSFPFALFDVDSRELAEAGGLGYRPRVAPIVEKLEHLYALTDRRGWPLVFTTCCSGRMPKEGDLNGVLTVPLDAHDEGWLREVSAYRRFYLAKRAYGDPRINAACRAFDMFQDNGNAERLLDALGAERWAVFGNGFDLCVASAARGILDAGYPVDLIEDVRISSAGGTPLSEAETIAELERRGARVLSLDDFLAENG